MMGGRYLVILPCILGLACLFMGSLAQDVVQTKAPVHVCDVGFIDNKTVIVLTDGDAAAKSRVWLSGNAGFDWKDQTSKLEGFGNDDYAIWWYTSPSNRNKVFVLGSKTLSWKTEDKGTTWTALRTTFRIRNLLFHPKQENWALARGPSFELYLTKDFGQSWKQISSTASRFSWGDAGIGEIPQNRIYLISTNGVNLVYTDDEGSSFSVVIEKAPTFLFRPHQLFTLQATGTKYKLVVTPDLGWSNKAFYDAQFPFGDTLENNGYAILDDTTESVFMGINHGNARAHWGNLYVSDASGAQYVSTLQHISQEFPYYDFERVRGLEGVYLTNVVTNWDETSGQKSNDLLNTLFTFNSGAEWVPITKGRPYFDSNNNPIQCSGCALHLHGQTSQESTDEFVSCYANTNTSKNFPGIYSSPNAVGLIIGVGNVGQYLSFDRTQVNTYFSRDAGATWIEVRKGPSIYEFGNHGGIIVLADYGVETNTIYYSLDEFKTIKSLTLSDTIKVVNIMADGAGTGANFFVIGTKQTATENEGVLIGLDFSKLFPRVCAEQDYELWKPNRTDIHPGSTECLMGRIVSFRRRKQDSLCINPEDLDPVVSTKNCACTPEDYECDFGYITAGDTTECIINPESGPISYPPKNCRDFYVKSTGYRRIAGDSCEGGLDRLPKESFSCGSSSGIQSWKVALIVVFVSMAFIIAILVATALAVRSERIREKIPFLKKLHNWRVGYFGMGSKPDTFEPEEFSSEEQQQQGFSIGGPDDDDEDKKDSTVL